MIVHDEIEFLLFRFFSIKKREDERGRYKNCINFDAIKFKSLVDMEISTNPVYKFSQRGICRVEYINGAFYFYGHKADKLPIVVQPRDMADLCAYINTTKEKADRTYQELLKKPDSPDETVASCIVSRVGNDEIRLEVQTYKGKVFSWLKLFCYSNGVRSPRSGQVIFNDVDPQTLKEFYLKCTEKN